MAARQQREHQRPSALRLIPRINRLTLEVRQYFPNGTDLSVYTQHDLDQVALRLNTRLRKTLGFQTPADTFERAVALTG